MRAATLRTLALAGLLAAVATVPAAAAEEGQLTADLVRYKGGGRQSGDLTVLFFADTRSVDGDILADPSPLEPATPFLDLKADRIEAVTVERRSLAGPDAGPLSTPVQDPTATPGPAARTVLEQAQAVLTSHQEGFQVHLLALDAPARFAGQSEAGEILALDSVYVSEGTFKAAPDQPDDPLGRDPESPSFWGVHVDQPHVVHDERSGRFSLVVMGDFVLELSGITLQASDHDQDEVLASGQWRESVAGTPLASQRDVLVRLFLEGATLRLSTVGGEPSAYVAAVALEDVVDGEATLLGASGTLESAAGTEQLADQSYQLGAGTSLSLAPGEPGRLAMSVAPVPATQAAGPAHEGPGAPWLVGLGAVLALLAAVGLGLLRRLTTAPDLRAVEVALEAGKYRRAARLAGRILRVRPGLEDAVLGRAIALSRGGRAIAAVGELKAHIAANGASDGSLHYVLGLALLDLGHRTDARAALDEAVRRTPALEADVAARLGPSPHVPANLREVHGYA